MSDLGFNKKLGLIKPSASTSDQTHDGLIDAVAKEHGFVSREPVEKIVRRRDVEASANLNIRPPITTYNRFVRWAMDNRLSYPEALKELLDRANVK